MQDLKMLVVKARQGNLDAYSQIVRRFQDMACGYGYGLFINGTDKEVTRLPRQGRVPPPLAQFKR